MIGVPPFSRFLAACGSYIDPYFHVEIVPRFCYFEDNSKHFYMNFTRIKETFLRLPLAQKMIGVGSLVLALATFLPWYEDVDAYKIGDRFLGITGPASFVGFAILAMAGLSLWIFSYHLSERRVPRLPVREAIINLAVSIESLFLLLLVNSIFFDAKFGVNITLKESRFGMVFAFVGAVVLGIGAYMQNREEIAAHDEVGRLEPLIKMDATAPAAATPKSSSAQAMPASAQPAPRIYPTKTFSKFEEANRNLFGHGLHKPLAARPQTQAPSTPAVTVHVAPPVPSIVQGGATPSREDKNGSYMHRLDL